MVATIDEKFKFFVVTAIVYNTTSSDKAKSVDTRSLVWHRVRGDVGTHERMYTFAMASTYEMSRQSCPGNIEINMFSTRPAVQSAVADTSQ